MQYGDFKIGDYMRIHDSLNRKGVDWYTPDIYFVERYIQPNTYFINLKGETEYSECLQLVTSTIKGHRLIASETKFVLCNEEGRKERLKHRELKLKYLLENEIVS